MENALIIYIKCGTLSVLFIIVMNYSTHFLFSFYKVWSGKEGNKRRIEAPFLTMWRVQTAPIITITQKHLDHFGQLQTFFIKNKTKN